MTMRRLAAAALFTFALAATSGIAHAQMLLAGEKEANITAIDGVISGDAKWQLVWASFKTADGIVGTPDGGLLFAQEQSNSVRKLGPGDKEQIYRSGLMGPGSVSMDAKGRVFALERTCTDPGLHMPSCEELPRVVQLAPERKLLANSFADGKSLGRVNDMLADGKGGAYFTSTGLYHVSADGVVTVVADKDIFTNGLMLSPNGKTLYVTNRTKIEAFDVKKDGSTSNRRVFATLGGEGQGFGGDGMAIDSEGRLYVTGDAGIYVFNAKGEQLGIIPCKRRAITVAFSGPDKKTLYVGAMGAVGPDGKPWATPEGVRNTAMTIYKIDMLAQGYKGRPK